jgi:hypothetical protein
VLGKTTTIQYGTMLAIWEGKNGANSPPAKPDWKFPRRVLQSSQDARPAQTFPSAGFTFFRLGVVAAVTLKSATALP